MNAMHVLAAAAIAMTTQVHAAPLTIVSNTLTATPSGQADGREINFKLPLNGDTSKCIVTISYGEKPGVGINNDGDTHINGQHSLDRVRTYSNDGTYKFTAKAKSGCTGEAEVTFVIGNPARAKPANLPLQPAAGISANPDVKLTHGKVTSVNAPPLVSAGNSFAVIVNGTGLQSDCPTTIVIDQLTPTLKSNYGNLAAPYQSSAWSRKYLFTLTEVGTYQARVLVNSPGSSEACGYKGEGTIAGDLSKIQVVAKVAN